VLSVHSRNDGGLMADSNASGFEILDLINESVFAFDRNNCITFWNKAAEKLYGWSKQEVMGRDAAQLLQCNHLDSSVDHQAWVLENGSWHGDLWRVTADGRRILVEADWTARRDDNGEPVEIFETSWDVTERRASEEKAALDAYRFRDLFESTEIAFWEMDMNEVRRMITSFRDLGVSDYHTYLLENRDVLRKVLSKAYVLDVNRKTLDLFGAGRREDMLGYGVERFWSEKGEQMLVDALVGPRALDPNYVSEVTLVDLHGNEVDVLLSASSSADGRKRGVILLALLDVGERKRAIADLKTSELRYRTIFNQMPTSFWHIDTCALHLIFDRLRQQKVSSLVDYAAEHPAFIEEAMNAVIIREVNEATLMLMGAKEQSELQLPIAKFWTESEAFLKSIEAAYTGGPRFSGVSRVKRLDGSIIDLLHTFALSTELSNQGLDLIGGIDVTRQRKAVQLLEDSELKYRNLFEHVPVSLWQLKSPLPALIAELKSNGVTNLDAYLEVNPGLLDEVMKIVTVDEVNAHTVTLMGGKSKSDFNGYIGKFWGSHPDTVRRSLEARYNGAPSYSEQVRIPTLDGRMIDVYYTSAFPPALAAMGITIIGMIDVSERVRTEDALDRLQADFAHAARIAMLGEFTASIAHEVNQPLSAIAASSAASLHWLDQEQPDIEEVRLLAAHITEDAQRAADIIDRTRKMAERRTPEHTPLPINAVIEEALIFVRHEVSAHHATIETRLEQQLPPAMGDRTQLQQILANLVLNALQAMTDNASVNRQIMISSSLKSAKKIEVRVDDTGPGLSDEQLPHLFSSFFTTKANGMGMGLAICRSIIESHGGDIIAENRSDQLGASFAFTIPFE
jgi:PAS domain S-box-containing protein